MLYITIGIKYLTRMEKRVIVVQTEDEFAAMILAKGKHFRCRRLNTAEYTSSRPPPIREESKSRLKENHEEAIPVEENG